MVSVTDDLAAIGDADVLIDFTRPDGSMAHLDMCVRLERAIVIGTTGFSDAQKGAISEAATRIPIVFSPNMSIGVNVTLRLLQIAARALAEDHDIEILEMHHRHKVDAPSGTALRMGESDRRRDRPVARRQRGLCARRRHRRARKSIDRLRVLRGGDVVGEHTVLFAGAGERIEITHRATSRNTFAGGAVRAARFLAGKSPGLYRMNDVLGLDAVG